MPMERKIPPTPPKPKIYQLPCISGNRLHPFMNLSNGTKLGALQPADSDTDSGICVDYDNNKLSPRQFQDNIAVNDVNKDKASQLTKPASSNVSGTNLRFNNAQKVKSTSLISRNTGKQYHVRFADQIRSPSEFFIWNNERSTLNTNDCTRFGHTGHNDGCTNCLPHQKLKTELVRKSANNSSNYYDSLSINDARLKSAPPSYEDIVNRFHRNDRSFRVDETPRAKKRYHNRSSSLPSKNYSPASYCSTTANQCLLNFPDYSFPAAHLKHMWYANDFGNNSKSNSSTRYLPQLPLYSLSNMLRFTPQFVFRQRDTKKNMFSNGMRSRSVAHLPRCISKYEFDCSKNYDLIHFRSRAQIPFVRTQLISLDRHGLRTVQVDKLKPGPFGFYIATGLINNRQGIFISRISLPSLTSVLSAGDEIVYIENELVKGRTLEYVQSLLADKTNIKIVLSPANCPSI